MNGCDGVVDRGGPGVFRGSAVVDCYHDDPGGVCESTTGSVVRFEIARHPAATVEVDDHCRPRGGRPVDTYAWSSGADLEVLDAVHFGAGWAACCAFARPGAEHVDVWVRWTGLTRGIDAGDDVGEFPICELG